MFVKIEEGSGQRVYQCLSYRLIPQDDPDELYFVMEMGSGSEVVVSARKDLPVQVGVYVMNDEGRTIDTVFRGDGCPVSDAVPAPVVEAVAATEAVAAAGS